MPYYKGKGYGEDGAAAEEVIEAESKYDAKEQFKEMFVGGLTVLSEVPADEAPEDEFVEITTDDVQGDEVNTETGGDDTPPAAA